MNISHFRFILFNKEIFGKIVHYTMFKFTVVNFMQIVVCDTQYLDTCVIFLFF